MFMFQPEEAKRIVSNRIELMAETQFNYIVGIIETSEYELVMEEAYRQGIAGDGVHNWFFGDSMLNKRFDGLYEIDSPLYLATKGIGIVSFSSMYSSRYGTYLSALNELNNDDDLEYLESTINNNNNNNDDDWTIPMDQLNLNEPSLSS